MIASISVTAPQRPSSGALTTLIAQHDSLRDMMDRCEDLAAQRESHPEGDPGELEREVKWRGNS